MALEFIYRDPPKAAAAVFRTRVDSRWMRQPSSVLLAVGLHLIPGRGPLLQISLAPFYYDEVAISIDQYCQL